MGVVCTTLIATNGQMTSSTVAATEYICGNKQLSSDVNMAIAFKFDNDAGMVYITMEGNADNWFGVGFGATSMSGTYAITIDSDGSATERKLGIYFFNHYV